jgi:predicted DNA-binding protein
MKKTKSAQKKRPRLILMTDALWERVRESARRADRTMSSFVRLAIEAALK